MALPLQFGAYVLLQRLGEGAQGDAHLARHVHDATPVVVKRIAAQQRTKGSFIRRFRHEAALATAIDSKNVVRVLNAGQVGDRLYIVMEYIHGWPLDRIIKGLKRAGTPPPVRSCVDVVCGALEGLGALHTASDPTGAELGIVHRDISPKNLMLAADGTVKVIDLGLGKSTMQDWATATGVVMGTPGYMSPEQAKAEDVDQRADLFAMGVVLFELLTLERYTAGRTVPQLLSGALTSHYRPPSSLRAEVPPGLDAIVRRAVALDPNERFPSARAFVDALRAEVPGVEAPARSLVEAVESNPDLSQEALDQLLSASFEPDPREVTRTQTFSQREPVASASMLAVTATDSAPQRPPAAGWGRRVAGSALLIAVGSIGTILVDQLFFARERALPAAVEVSEPAPPPPPSVRVVPKPKAAAQPPPEETPPPPPPPPATPRRTRGRAPPTPSRPAPKEAAREPVAPGPAEMRAELKQMQRKLLLQYADAPPSSDARKLAARIGRVASSPTLERATFDRLRAEYRAAVRR